MSKLTPKQCRFVDEYLVDLNATQAAIRAGYSEKTAREQGARLLSKVHIQAAIQVGQSAAQKRTRRTMDDVLADLRAVAQDAMQKIPDKEGNLLMANHNAAIKAIELEGRHLGMFAGVGQGETERPIHIEIVNPHGPS
tara:strand:- start:589 stop:1002 length:414 start_codon:yes stop_codon:yes gene_type:complete